MEGRGGKAQKLRRVGSLGALKEGYLLPVGLAAPVSYCGWEFHSFTERSVSSPV